MDRLVFNQRLGARIRTFRKRQGLTLARLGKDPTLSLSGTSIANVEAGRQQITVYQMFCFAAALGTSVGELLAGVSESNEKLPRLSKKMKNITEEL